MLSENSKEIQMLLRSVKSERFHLIIIQYNHHSIIYMVKKILQESYPTRNAISLVASNTNYRSIIDQIYKQGKDFLYIDDFENIINNPNIYVAFNQRRDKLTSFPIQLICFVPTNDQIMNDFVEHMPDLWSLRNLTLNLEVPLDFSNITSGSLELDPISSLGGRTSSQKREELETIIKSIADTEVISLNTLLIQNLYDQALILCKDLNLYSKALELIDQWERTFSQESYNTFLSNKVSILEWKGIFLLDSGKISKSIDTFNDALSLAHSIDDKSIDNIKYSLARAYTKVGDYQKSMHIYEELLSTNFIDDDYSKEVIVNASLATSYAALNDYKKAHKILNKIINNSNLVKTSEKGMLAYLKSVSASVNYALGNYDEARLLLEDSLKIEKSIHGENHFQVNLAKNQLGTVLLQLNINEYAISLLKEAYESSKIILGNSHLTTFTYKVNLVDAYIKVDDYISAIKVIDLNSESSIISINKEFLTKSFLRTIYELAHIYYSLDYHDKAIELCDFILSNITPFHSYNDEFTLSVRGQLGELYLVTRDKSNAFKTLDSVYIMSKRHLGDNHILTIHSESNLGLAYTLFGAYGKAQNHILHAYDKAKLVFNKDSRELNHLWLNLAFIYMVNNNQSEAIKIFDESIKILKKRLGMYSYYVISTEIILAELYYKINDKTSAQEIVDRVYPILKELFSSFDHPSIKRAESLINALNKS